MTLATSTSRQHLGQKKLLNSMLFHFYAHKQIFGNLIHFKFWTLTCDVRNSPMRNHANNPDFQSPRIHPHK